MVLTLLNVIGAFIPQCFYVVVIVKAEDNREHHLAII
jgi:hypothetical protein